MADFLKVERSDTALLVTMNRPDERNAISDGAACAEFEQICCDADADPTVSAVIITGAGSAFSAGGNLKALKERSGFASGKTPMETRNNYRANIHRIPAALYELDIPTIAAVNGPAIGAGFDLACMCDIRIASETALFAESFVRLGLVSGDGGAWLLPRIVGHSRAAEMCFTGETIDAQAALASGLVSKVVPPEQLLDEVLALAARIAVNPVQAVRLTKRLLREGERMRLSSLLELSGAFQALVHETPEHQAAIAKAADRQIR